MSAVWRQLLVLFAFILVGYLLGRYKKLGMDKSNVISVLLVYVFLPCKIFLNFSENCTSSYLLGHYPTLLFSVCLLLLLAGLSWVLAKLLTKNPYDRRVYRYSFAISNYAYLGYVLVESVLGAQALTDMILFCIPFAFYTYTFGYALLTGGGGLFKKLLNPMTVAIVLGMLFGIVSIPVPQVLSTALGYASACTGPMSMLLTGMVLASFPIRELLPNGQTLIFCLIRLLAIPAVLFGLCLGCGRLGLLPQAAYPAAVIMGCMPCGLNTIVFPSLMGEDCRMGARFVLLSHVLCLLTIPLWMMLLT
ncbi:MAG: AEC family transporter [Ruminococcaceae bacterium]|nr:AEC family transporter [Oscillospiraceae bacterium]